MNKIEKLIRELCPEGVKFRKLFDCTTLQAGDRVTKADMNPDGMFPAYGAGTVPTGYLDRSNFENCLIFARAGAGAGYVNFIEGKFWATDVCFVSNQDPDGPLIKFVYYWMKNNERDLMRQTYGGSMPKINKKYLWNHPVPVPPLEVQQEIISILDKFTGLEAELEAELEKRGRQYEFFRSDLVSAFGGTDVQVVKFAEVASIVRGASPRPIQSHLTTSEDGISWIKIGDVDPSEKYITKTVQKIKADSVRHSRLVRPGDFVLTNSMSFGRPYISKIHGCIHDGWLAISDFQERLDPDYLFHLLRSDFIQDELRKRASNGTVSNLNAEIVRSIELPLPPLEKQTEIAARLDSFEALIGSVSQGLPAEIEARRKQYEYYRNKLLTFKELDAA